MRWILRLFHRSMVLFVGLACLLLGFYLPLAYVRQVPLLSWHGMGLQLALEPELAQPIVWLVIGVGLVLAGAILAVLALIPYRSSTKVEKIVLALPQDHSDTGLTVTMSRNTLCTLVRLEARQVEGIREVDASVSMSEKGWDLHCQVGAWRSSPLRELSDEVADRLRRTLHLHTGIPVSSVTIDLGLSQKHPTRRALQ